MSVLAVLAAPLRKEAWLRWAGAPGGTMESVFTPDADPGLDVNPRVSAQGPVCVQETFPRASKATHSGNAPLAGQGISVSYTHRSLTLREKY